MQNGKNFAPTDVIALTLHLKINWFRYFKSSRSITHDLPLPLVITTSITSFYAENRTTHSRESKFINLLILAFFFFFIGFAPTWLDSCRIGFDSCRTGLIRPELGRIESYWPVADTAETGRKWPKSALKLIGTAEILTLEVFLAFFFLCFVNQRKYK